jgi:hypothetical protein
MVDNSINQLIMESFKIIVTNKISYNMVIRSTSQVAKHYQWENFFWITQKQCQLNWDIQLRFWDKNHENDTLVSKN